MRPTLNPPRPRLAAVGRTSRPGRLVLPILTPRQPTGSQAEPVDTPAPEPLVLPVPQPEDAAA